MNNAFDNGFKNPTVGGAPTPPTGNYGVQTTPAFGDNNGATRIDITPNFGSVDTTALAKLILVYGSAADKAIVTAGTVNLQTPTLGGAPISDSPPPEITVTEDIWVYVKVVGTFGAPDTYVITIHTENTDTPPTEDISATEFTSYFFIGSIDYTAGSPATIVIANDHTGGNLGVESFGSINLWWKK
jgi:hypothetical protein